MNIKNRTEINQAVNYLKSKGLVVNINDTRRQLKNFYFTKPEFLWNSISKVFLITIKLLSLCMNNFNNIVSVYSCTKAYIQR